MGNGNASIRVATTGQVACVKLEGRASFACSVEFKRLIQDLCRRGVNHFVVDLGACPIMDSTFLGMLAGLGTRMCAEGTPVDRRPIELLNPTDRVTELLDNLGVAHLFSLSRGATPEDLNFVEIDPAGGGRPTKLDLSRNCLEAHRILMDLNPENVAKFTDVTRFFEAEVKKAEAEAKA